MDVDGAWIVGLYRGVSRGRILLNFSCMLPHFSRFWKLVIYNVKNSF